MFKVVAEPRKRRVWSPRTVAASAAFHLLLLAGLVTAAQPAARPLVPPDTTYYPVPREGPRVARADPPPAPRLDEPQTAKSGAPQLNAPTEVPPVLPPPSLDFTPAMPARYFDAGPAGDAAGTADSNTASPAGNAEPRGGDNELPVYSDAFEEWAVDTRPELANQRQAELILQRHYPPLLRDTGATGRTVVQLIVGRDGKVEPGSVRIQESTDEAFNAAAIRAVQQFRFKPATLNGRRVAVLVTIPIEWRLEN